MRWLNALWMSFYSRPLYREVLEHWKGVGFLYLCLLALIKTLFIAVLFDANLDVMMRDYAPSIVQQIPAITIHNAQASTPESKAYSIRDIETGRLLALIDTRLEKIPADQGKIPVFVGRKSVTWDYLLLLTNEPGTPLVFPYLPTKEDNIIDQARIVSYLKNTADWGTFLAAPLLFGMMVISLVLDVLFFSLFTWITLKSGFIRCPYTSILRLTVISLSPAILVTSVLNAFYTDNAIVNFLFVVLAFVYISYGIHAIKNPEKELSDKNSGE